MDLTDQRINYEAEGLDLSAMDPDPFVQFERWFADAESAGDPEPYAMVLSTVDADGRPRGRSVLLRGVDSGFIFYTNYESAKARALDHAGVAALSFRWFAVHRQVHVEGTVERVSAEQSDDYFAKRPRESQLGAWASAQSSVIDERAALLDKLEEVTRRFDGREVARPPFWGGYRVVPQRVEFWQGQPSRLHDRLAYDRSNDGWERAILSP